MRASVCVSVHVSKDALGSQKRVYDPLQLELQAGVSCQIRVQGTELGSSARMVRVLNC